MMKYSGIFDSNGEKLLSYSREKLMNYFDLKDFLPPPSYMVLLLWKDHDV